MNKITVMRKWFLVIGSCFIANIAFANLSIPMHLVQNNQPIGKVVVSQSPYGLIFTPHLHNLPAGIHGFHIHQSPSCANKAMAAKGHWDPKQTGKHKGPYRNGHLGDLPVLVVNQQEKADVPVLVPRLHSLQQIKSHALMIHIGGDNYSDVPKKLGGGGSRLACGVISP